jgi:hypothetical protein
MPFFLSPNFTNFTLFFGNFFISEAHFFHLNISQITFSMILIYPYYNYLTFSTLKFLAKKFSKENIGDLLRKNVTFFLLLIGNSYKTKYDQMSEFFL